MSGHGDTEDAKNEVGLPLDVDESGWSEVAEGEVEDPVGSRGQGYSLAPIQYSLSQWFTNC